ncbi:MAG: hypothetical protein HQL75_00165 [Magnetococcales bacterium]|nr:hypothetical protein [Magnetococcales bacterium]
MRTKRNPINACDCDWFPPLNEFYNAPRYFSRRDAEQAAKIMGIGAGNVLKIAFRFETVWMVGLIQSHPEVNAGVVQDVLRLPMESFTGDKRDVATFRKVRRG